MISLKEKENFSLLLILPLVANKNSKYYDYIGIINSSVSVNNFINAYSSDTNNPHLDKNLFMVFDADNSIHENANFLKNSDEFIKSYPLRINKIHYNIYAFSIRYEFDKDYKEIMNGNYSGISDNTKKFILEFWSRDKNYSLYSILYNADIKYSKASEEAIPEEDMIYKWVDML